MDKRYAILGDIHSNLEALNAIVEDARSQSATDFLCVGDVIGYNSNPRECIDIIRGLGCLTVRGNHDHYCSYDERLDDFQPMAAMVIEWTRRQLRAEDVEWLHDLPYVRKAAGLTLVHSTLDMPEHWGYVFDALDAEASMLIQDTALCFHGHTHVPVCFRMRGGVATREDPADFKLALGARYFVNVGSVGQPRDGVPFGSYALYDAKAREVVFRRIPYDIETAMDKNRKAGLPERLAERLAVGR